MAVARLNTDLFGTALCSDGAAHDEPTSELRESVLICGPALEGLDMLPDRSVRTVVTSPPTGRSATMMLTARSAGTTRLRTTSRTSSRPSTRYQDYRYDVHAVRGPNSRRLRTVWDITLSPAGPATAASMTIRQLCP